MFRVYLIDHGKSCELDFTEISGRTVKDLSSFTSIPDGDFYVVCNGIIAPEYLQLVDGGIYRAVPRLSGGKGGFGSMLRTIGAQIEKTTNREACRDLSGRRMRDINNEKKLQEWVAKQAERDREREEQRRQRMERRRQVPKHAFDDPNYVQQKSKVIENLGDAVQQGLKRTLLSTSTEEPVIAGKKAKPLKAASASASSSKGTASEWVGEFEDNLSSDANSSGDEPCCSRPQPAAAAGAATAETFFHSSDCDDSSGNSVEGKSSPAALECAGKRGEGSDDARDSVSPATVQQDLAASSIRAWDQSESDDSARKVVATGTDSISNVAACSVNNESAQDVGISRNVSVKSEELLVVVKREAVSKNTPDASGSAEAAELEVVEEALSMASSAEHLEKFGLDTLKSALIARGMKCGGTLQERARRLFSVKGIAPSDIDPKLLAGPATNSGMLKKKKETRKAS